MEIDYEAEGIPVLSAQFADEKGKPLWTEEPYQFSRCSAINEYLVKDSVRYYVTHVAVFAGVMYVNLKRGS